MSESTTELNFNNAINYHYDQFPPNRLDYEKLIVPLSKAAESIARYDQMLKKRHNREI